MSHFGGMYLGWKRKLSNYLLDVPRGIPHLDILDIKSISHAFAIMIIQLFHIMCLPDEQKNVRIVSYSTHTGIHILRSQGQILGIKAYKICHGSSLDVLYFR